ncbi:hypothetical protein ACLKA7_002547 [Drosophila subpalustris]
MIFKYIMLVTALLVLAECKPAKQYQFIPARCVDHPGAEEQIGGPLSLCSFPPKYQTADNEDIQAVINHIRAHD